MPITPMSNALTASAPGGAGRTSRLLRRGVAAALALAAAVAPAALRADALPHFAPYAGAGNVSIFDSVTGSIGWVGQVDGFVRPDGSVRPLVSVVLARFDATAQSLAGSFEWTAADDLSSTLYGRLSGTAAADVLDQGGQFSLDYVVDGGSGLFAGASGWGLAFLDFAPQAQPDSYAESGVFVYTVAEPPGWALCSLLLVCAARGRTRRLLDLR